MKYVLEPQRELPIIGEYDVIVLGGGPAGISAAVSSAKTGAKTAIVERYGYLGGQATGGLIILLVGLTDGKQKIIKGFCEDTINRLNELGATENIGNHVLFDPESMKYVFDCFIQENQIFPYFHNYVSNVIKTENGITGVVLEGKSGRRVIKARAFVDATGDADIAKYCNIPFEQESKDKTLPVTLGFRVGGVDPDRISKFIRENPYYYKSLLTSMGISIKIGGWTKTVHKKEAWFNISHVENIDITDTQDLTRAEIIGRRQIHQIVKSFKSSMPGFEEGYLIDTAPQIGIRDSRRIKGVYRYTNEDIARTFTDSIAKAPDYSGSGRGSIEIPYGCLISKEINNVIFAGRGISVDHKLIDMFREIPCCMATGQAAGIAAAITSEKSPMADFHNIDVKQLQEKLLSQGALFKYHDNYSEFNLETAMQI